MRMVAASLLTLASLVLLGLADGVDLHFKGDEQLSHIVSPLPYTYLKPKALPKNFYWGNVDGKSYTTRMLNQHLPQYCGT